VGSQRRAETCRSLDQQPRSDATIEQTYQSNTNALKSLRSALAAGKLTEAIRRQDDRKFVEGFLPSETLPGL